MRAGLRSVAIYLLGFASLFLIWHVASTWLLSSVLMLSASWSVKNIIAWTLFLLLLRGTLLAPCRHGWKQCW